MTFEVRLARAAADYLRRPDRRSQERVIQRLDQIAADPFGPYSKPLTNLAGRRSARVGGWRIIFTVDVGARIVAVSDIAPRGEVYRRLH